MVIPVMTIVIHVLMMSFVMLTMTLPVLKRTRTQ
jgi:hypothetical protein